MTYPARTQWGQAQAVLLISLAGAIVALFAITTLFVNSYAKLESRLGSEWYDRGVSHLKAGDPERAVTDLRTALSYSREVRFRLELARALVAAKRTQEAREYLLALWERQPGSAELNLELARVSAISQAIPAAIGYYDAAVYGAWDNSPELNRRNTRLELARFLLAHSDKRRAAAVLSTLATDLPPDAQLQSQVGSLLLDAGDAAAARRLFEAALLTTRNYVPAIGGAGEAAFASKDFPAAERFLSTYRRERPDDPRAASMLDVTRAALDLDPLRAHLNTAERRKRALAVFHDAQLRISDCAARQGGALPPPDLQAAATKLSTQATNATERNLRRDPDLIEEVFAASANAISVSSKWCGARHPTDEAIAAAAQLHGVRP